jgi:hypothetical protein
MTQIEIDAMAALCRSRGQTFTQDDIDMINSERRTTYESQQRLKRGIPYTEHASQRPQNGQGTPPDRVPVGKRNRYGEECLGVDPESGASIYECTEGHVYVGNNPFVLGCTQCALDGSTRETIAVVHDDGAVEGEDSRW